MISWTECLYVKFTAGIFYTRSGKCIDFQLTVMSRCHRADFPLVQVGQNGSCKCSSFGWIGSGAELIEQHKRVLIHVLQEGNDIGHMRREGTETLLDTLLIADIRIHFVEQRQF